MEKIHIWMDVDTGVDDAVALLCATQEDSIILEGASAVAGNQTLDKTFKNTRDVLSLGGRADVKVFAGKDKSLKVELHTAEYFHGKNGLGNAVIDESKAPIEKEDAIDALYKKAKELNGELYIVSIGALTNIASAIFKYPDIVKYIKEIAFGGGSVGKGGSRTIAAENNVYFDPHAAQSVFKSGIPVTMLGLDVAMESYLNSSELDILKESKGEIGKIINNAIPLIDAKSKKLHGDDKFMLFDLCPFLYLDNQELYKGRKAGVYVETESPLSMGRTVSDIFVHADELFKIKNVMVMIEANRDLIAKYTLESFKSYR